MRFDCTYDGEAVETRTLPGHHNEGILLVVSGVHIGHALLHAIQNVYWLQCVAMVPCKHAQRGHIDVLTEEEAEMCQGHAGTQDVQQLLGTVYGMDEVETHL